MSEFLVGVLSIILTLGGKSEQVGDVVDKAFLKNRER